MVRFRNTGTPYQKIMDELMEFHALDSHFTDGRIIGSMCTQPDDIAKEAYSLFIETNLGNPGLCPGTVELEHRVMDMLLDLLHLDPSAPGNEHAGGRMITGGTEANITALWIARNLTGRNELIFPESAHFSLFKAADILGMKTRIIPLTHEYRMDIEQLKEHINDQTAAVVGVAGTTELGQVDPIHEMGEICLDAGIPLHVDAAFGGFVLPFLNTSGSSQDEAGSLHSDFSNLAFDFRSPGVTTIGVDPHKMGMATIPSGALLLRDMRTQEKIAVRSPYLTTEMNMSLSGTRNSASVAATYAVMTYLGRDGYKKIVHECMDNTRYLEMKLRELGLESVIKPIINVLAVRCDDPSSVITEMNKHGWKLSRATHPPSLRFVIMPHIRKQHIDQMVADLKVILN